MSKLSEAIALLTSLDHAVISLFRELQRQGQCTGPYTNEQIVQAAENRLVSLWKSLREKEQELNDLREICAKRFRWITKAREAMHPECGVTDDPDSFRGKTFRQHQTGEIERIQEINNNLIEANERLSAYAENWDTVCKALWDRGYGQLPQQVNETPLGSCLRLIDQGSPEFDGSSQALRQAILKREEPPVNTAWNALMADAHAKAKTEGANNPLFGHVAVHCVDGQVYTTPLPDTTIALEVARARLEKVPVKITDLPLGTTIRYLSHPTTEALIVAHSPDKVWTGGGSPPVDEDNHLVREGYEYRLPGTEDWKPCYKLVPRTPPATA